ncbi:hypothetical protein K1T71_009056 [Dendrolimus kikuchii]|uniref:Uncharacterized protein n=1 Tax=Dendrolimus kikuchii TaxID=765133 RepID=A0ACC1CTG8_9NEOP|nr:hypothetical protein K1T71_009056 [Dendrolimus kikuchii]
MFRTPKKPLTGSGSTRGSTSDDEAETVSPRERTQMMTTAEVRGQIDALGEERRKMSPPPTKKAVTLKFSPPKKTAKVTAEVDRKPMECLNRTYTRAKANETAGIASTSAVGPTRELARSPIISPLKGKCTSRETEAKACVDKIDKYLSDSRNLKTEIKRGVEEMVNRLYVIVREGEKAMRELRNEEGKGVQNREQGTEVQIDLEENRNEVDIGKEELMRKLEEHAALMRDSTMRIKDLQGEIDRHREELRESRMSYASVVSGKEGARATERPTLHSVVITDKNQEISGDEVLDKL